MNTYSSTIDKLSRIVTSCIAYLGLGILVISGIGFYKSGYSMEVLVITLFGPVVIFGMIIGLYLYRTQNITTDENGLTIVRAIQPIFIAYTDITDIRMPVQQDMKNTMRTFGNGGIFGYTGRFYNKQLGSMKWYCTQRGNYVLIETKNKKRILITPDDPNGLMRDLLSRKGLSLNK